VCDDCGGGGEGGQVSGASGRGNSNASSKARADVEVRQGEEAEALEVGNTRPRARPPISAKSAGKEAMEEEEEGPLEPAKVTGTKRGFEPVVGVWARGREKRQALSGRAIDGSASGVNEDAKAASGLVASPVSTLAKVNPEGEKRGSWWGQSFGKFMRS